MTAWCMCWWLVFSWASSADAEPFRAQSVGPYQTRERCEQSARTALDTYPGEWDSLTGWGGRPQRWHCERR